MVDLRYVFNLLSVLNERSHSADIIGNVHKMRIKVWILGKNSRSRAASVWTALMGNTNKYHNDVPCTYCKNRSKQRISGIKSPLHSCWDKITVKNRRGGVPWRERGVPEPLEPSPGYAPAIQKALTMPQIITSKSWLLKSWHICRIHLIWKKKLITFISNQQSCFFRDKL